MQNKFGIYAEYLCLHNKWSEMYWTVPIADIHAWGWDFFFNTENAGMKHFGSLGDTLK